MGEPRIHFAIVCASFSCPLLRSEAYTAEFFGEQLDSNTRQFVNDVARNRLDRTEKVAHISQIFEWYAEEFEAHSGSVLAYVAQYVEDPDLYAALREDANSIEHLK